MTRNGEFLFTMIRNFSKYWFWKGFRQVFLGGLFKKKREYYREAFDNFNPEKVAKYDDKKRLELLQNEGIVRNKLKIKSVTRNAIVFLQIQKEFGSFDKYLWGYVNGKPIQNKSEPLSEVPAKTDLSDLISTDFKKRGMNFLGSTIVYAFIQAVGMVNDHIIDCFRCGQK